MTAVENKIGILISSSAVFFYPASKKVCCFFKTKMSEDVRINIVLSYFAVCLN